MIEPEISGQGWRFATPDPVNGAEFMHQIYSKADPHVTGRVTVPVLWDKQTGTLVNNESAEILRMFNSCCGALASGPDLYPEAFRPLSDRRRLYRGGHRAVCDAGAL